MKQTGGRRGEKTRGDEVGRAGGVEEGGREGERGGKWGQRGSNQSRAK